MRHDGRGAVRGDGAARVGAGRVKGVAATGWAARTPAATPTAQQARPPAASGSSPPPSGTPGSPRSISRAARPAADRAASWLHHARLPRASDGGHTAPVHVHPTRAAADAAPAATPRSRYQSPPPGSRRWVKSGALVTDRPGNCAAALGRPRPVGCTSTAVASAGQGNVPRHAPGHT